MVGFGALDSGFRVLKFGIAVGTPAVLRMLKSNLRSEGLLLRGLGFRVEQ